MSASGTTEQTPIPTTGMRGGLGRNLLTAFLALAIVPLSIISWYATVRARNDIQREVTAKLSSVAASMQVQVQDWMERHVSALVTQAALPDTRQNTSTLIGNTTGSGTSSDSTTDETARESLRAQLETLLETYPVFYRLDVLAVDGQVLASTNLRAEGSWVDLGAAADQPSGFQTFTLDPTAEAGLFILEHIASQDEETIGLLTGALNLSDLAARLETVGELGETGRIYLVDADGMALPQGARVSSAGIDAALEGRNGDGLHNNYEGVPVIGVYRPMSDLGLVLAAEQEQGEAFASTYAVTAAVIGFTLIVALFTAIIAAVVTQQITRPVVRLTESALKIAEGELDQRVPVKSRDEIGILAYVFNRMAAELKALYDDLEGKVAKRTALLQKANYQIQRRAIQMQASLEVGQAVNSILDPDELLEQVVGVIRGRFLYSCVAVYTVDADGGILTLRASDGEANPFHGRHVSIDSPALIGRAFQTREAALESRPVAITVGPPASYTRSELALPLCLGSRTMGVLDVQCTDEQGFDQDDVSVLRNVANQVAVALENARSYVVEREAVERLRELDRSKRRFLANMSHELRTPLTNIVGFSQLLLRGIDGRLTDSQHQDIEMIYQDSKHLVGLINDLLDISQIEAGLMELDFQDVCLVDLIRSVMATASALVRDRDIELRQRIADNLPTVRADTARIRQVLVQLLANAAKFTERGSILVQAWPEDEHVFVSVSDTGVGILPEDQERIFEQFEQVTVGATRPNGTGLGLALSKEFVEMHGGRIWVDSKVAQGSTFTFSLPLRQPSTV